MKPEFVEQVKEMDGAEKVLPLYVFKNNVQGNSEPISRLEGTDNLEWYNSMFALHYTDSPMSEQAALSFASGERAVIINEDCMKRGGFSIGDTITLSNGTSGNSYFFLPGLSVLSLLLLFLTWKYRLFSLLRDPKFQ